MFKVRSQMLNTAAAFGRITFAGSSLLWLLSGCATQSPSPIDDPTHAAAKSPKPAPTAAAVAPSIVTVKRGDTLYAIAFERGLDFRDIASWNQIAPPYTIFPGQRLLMAPPQSARATPAEAAQPAVAKVPPAPSRQVFQPLPSSTPKPAAEGTRSTQALAQPAAAPPAPMQASAKPASAPSTAGSTEAPPRATAKLPEPPGKAAASKTPSPVATASTQENKNATNPAASSTAALAKPVPAASSGQWRWPTQGKVAVAYGVAGRKGIVIDGAAGQSVSATRDGEVVYAGGGLLGYGQLVIVKHDEVYLSAYGNNSRLLVKEGAKVKAGEPIAEMGASGDGRTGLHFELRKNGRPIDPLTLLKAP